MRLTVATEEGSTFNIDVDPGMELENVAALLEAETGIPPDDQLLFASGKQLTGKKETLASQDVKEDDVLLLRRNSEPSGSNVAGR
ncbi:ubiquitin-related domain-containing protein [Leucosporidium creatinivorum]|uniref:Ubiquitin-related domain-containing protein n=1 Tax=Leucosporidium creatinivorum TaxID=106004 RepID=A0A1Y2DGC2_9BASI|nr:ubiquitin-related domain-containing protein [Leucosporidium creatinivorum]